ncbi:hypothetical protein GCM10027605_14790 [Micromonospora zhanjiangensis]
MGHVDPSTLTEPERQLWDAFPRRELVDLTGREDRRIRADVIRTLLLGAQPDVPGSWPRWC